MTKRQRVIDEEETPIYRKLWSSTEETSAVLGINRTRLMELKAGDELVPGRDWVYCSGKKTGVLGWDLEAMQKWQREKTMQLAQAPSEEETPIFSESIERAENRIDELKTLIKVWKDDRKSETQR